jgi:hypothetical protein
MKAILLLLLLLTSPALAQDTSTRPRRVTEPPKPKTAKQLTVEYRDFLENLLPRHKDIHVVIEPQFFKSSYLIAYHPLFDRHSLRYGSLVDHIWKWLVEHKDELKAANIGSVGVGYSFPYDVDTLEVKDAFPKQEKKK